MSNFEPEKMLKHLSRRRTDKPDTNELINKKTDELLFYVHMLKNSTTVKTSEFEALTRIFTGQLMYVDTRDLSVAPHLMMSGKWEEGITTVFQALVNEGDTVLDVGANFGFFGVVAGSELGSGGRLMFVEANPILIPYIKKSLSVNGLVKKSVIVQKAVSNKKGIAPFNFLEDVWGSSGMQELPKEWQEIYPTHEVIDVETDTIDAICKQAGITSANVIKIDIEGYENFAFEGMGNLIKNSPELKVFLEFTPERYPNAGKFFKDIKKKLQFIYFINEDASIIAVESFEELNELHGDDWSMLIASKTEITL